ncbi:unnamed protein product, partial [Symbiodinium sp. CCMP2456]
SFRILRDYYSGKKARISVEGGLSDEFDLETGLVQGCCVAPLLFNIFLAAVVEAWVGESGGGVHWLTRIDGALLHREAQGKYSSWEALDLHELGYADDAALIADTLSQLHGVAKGFQLHLREWGLQLSVEKTEAMSSAPGVHAPIPVEEFEGIDGVKFSEYFEYLGVIMQRNGSGDMAVKERVEKAKKAFWSLNSSVWNVRQLLELASGGREALARTLMTEVRERVRANPEVDMEELCCDLVECSFQDAETEGDLAMFWLLVSTVLLSLQANLTEFSRSPYTGVTPRRVSRKMCPPAWYVKKQDDAKAILDGARVRTKYWNLRNVPKTTDVSDGDYACDFPGCGRRYTTKGGLSHHKLITHKVGTFRQAGFDCKLCPRSFEREMWLTRHVNYDHPFHVPVLSRLLAWCS